MHFSFIHALHMFYHEFVCGFFPFTIFVLFIFFALHQQPASHACGFYVIHHMVKAMELLSMHGDPEV